MPTIGSRRRKALVKLVEEAAAASQPLDRLAPLVELETINYDLVIEAVMDARGAGHTWTKIAEILGVSKQAVRERFGRYDVEAMSKQRKRP